ncbi:MAG: hypothetical protein KDB11_32555 [Planctomycetales bacterium]|nr:hypothetical protein [Planctomycetales bacterium]
MMRLYCAGFLLVMAYGILCVPLLSANEIGPEDLAYRMKDLYEESRQAAGRLAASLTKDSEARVMFESILDGSQLGPEDSWFPRAESQTRTDWTMVQKLFDLDRDDRVTAEEFPGPEPDFETIDRDHDGVIIESDLHWPEHAVSFVPGAMFFRALDQDGNGKITESEQLTWFDKMNQRRDGYLTLDDLRTAFPLTGMKSDSPRPEHPSIETLQLALERERTVNCILHTKAG